MNKVRDIKKITTLLSINLFKVCRKKVKHLCHCGGRSFRTRSRTVMQPVYSEYSLHNIIVGAIKTDTNNEQNPMKLADGSCRQVGNEQTENLKLQEEQNPYGAYIRPMRLNKNDEIIEIFSRSEIKRWSPWTRS